MTYMMSGCTALVGIMSGRVSKFGSILFSNVSNKIIEMFKFELISICTNLLTK